MFKKTLCLVLVATMSAGYTNAAVIDVDIQSLAFNPQVVVINVGDSVKWTNLDSFTNHTSTSLTLLWDSGSIVPLDTWEHEYRMVFVENPYWYDAKGVTIERINCVMVVEDSTAFAIRWSSALWPMATCRTWRS